eukprot:521881-Amphidinium_carterae.1
MKFIPVHRFHTVSPATVICQHTLPLTNMHVITMRGPQDIIPERDGEGLYLSNTTTQRLHKCTVLSTQWLERWSYEPLVMYTVRG